MKYGFNPKLEQEHQDGTEWLGSELSVSDMAKIPYDDRLKYLPKGERQNIGEEKMDCASRAPLNILETKFNWLIKNKKLSLANDVWLRSHGYVNKEDQVEFSDRWIAIKSGTTREGNSLKAPCQAVHEWGLLPKNLFPQVESFDEYYDPSKITEEMESLAKEWKQRFFINYLKESDTKKDMNTTGVNAWPTPENGIYKRTDDPFNHAIDRVYPVIIFDNYEEGAGDFLKEVSPDYNFLPYGYRLVVNKEIAIPVKKNWIQELLEKMVEFIIGITKLPFR